MVVTDLILCLIRGCLGMFGTLVIFLLSDDPEMVEELAKLGFTAWVELVTAFGILIVGISASIGLLLKQRWGLVWGYATAAITVVSILAGLSQGMIKANQGPANAAGFARIVAVFLLLIRSGLLGMYVVALVQYTNYFQRDTASRGTGFAR